MRTRVERPSTPTPSLREALHYFVRLLMMARPYWGGMSRSLLLGVFVGVLGMIAPYAAKLYFDEVYPSRDVALLRVLVLAVAALTLTSTLMSAIRGYYSQVISARLSGAVSLMYFNHLQHLPLRFFDEHRVGELMSRFSDMRGALSTLSKVFQTIVVSGIYLLLVPPFLVALNWRLSIVAVFTVPVTIVLSTATSRIVRRYMKLTAERSAELSAIQVEVLSQIRTLKAMAAEPLMFRQAQAQTDDVITAQLRGSAVSTVVGVGNGLVRALGTAVFTWFAWTLILHGDMSLGDFVAFSAYIGFVSGPMSQVAGMFSDFQQTAVTLGRAFEYLDVEPEQDPELAYHAPQAISRPVRGEISIENVSFSYVEGRPVLSDITLELKPGTITAVVGPSGSGKSSLVRLLCRMGEPHVGRILLDGAPLHSMPLAEVRRQVAVVWQEPSLLRGTVWENLALGTDKIDRDRVERAIRVCQLEELIEKLPEGYDTPVAEWGATLSGGQRQRFTIARALLRDTPILLFDEVTSQVDMRTEEKLLYDLFLHVRDKTVVFVTHRLSAATLADSICVMEAGRLVGTGTHPELVRDNSVYRGLLQASSLGDDSRRLRVVGAT